MGQQVSSASKFPFTPETLVSGRGRASDSPARVFDVWSGTDTSAIRRAEAVTVLTYDPAKADFGAAGTAAARENLRKSKTLLHPFVLKFLAGTETSDGVVHIVTEEGTPLKLAARREEYSTIEVAQHVVGWGLWCLADALEFLHSRSLSLGAFGPEQVFVCRNGDFKFFGFEYMDPLSLRSTQFLLPEDFSIFETIQDACARDWWCFSRLVPAVFSLFRVQMPTTLLSSLRTPGLAGSRFAAFKAALAAISRYVDVRRLLCDWAIEDADKKERFVSELPSLLQWIPSEAGQYAVLPRLLEMLTPRQLSSAAAGTSAPQSGGHGSSSSTTTAANTVSMLSISSAMASKTLAAILLIGQLLSPSDYAVTLVPAIQQLFTVPDRNLRMALLSHLHQYIEFMTPAVVSDDLWPCVVGGFSDATPALRDSTLKSCVLWAPKLQSPQLQEMAGYIWKLQTDTETSIRTNSVICLGKVSGTLDMPTRKKMLVASVQRALKDVSLECRIAAVASLGAMADVLDLDDCAQKAIPVVSPFLVAADREVAESAFRTVQTILQRIRKSLDAEPTGPPSAGANGITTGKPEPAVAISAAAGLSTLTGAMSSWAQYAIFKKVAPGPETAVVDKSGPGRASTAGNPPLQNGSLPPSAGRAKGVERDRAVPVGLAASALAPDVTRIGGLGAPMSSSSPDDFFFSEDVATSTGNAARKAEDGDFFAEWQSALPPSSSTTTTVHQAKTSLLDADLAILGVGQAEGQHSVPGIAEPRADPAGTLPSSSTLNQRSRPALDAGAGATTKSRGGKFGAIRTTTN